MSYWLGALSGFLAGILLATLVLNGVATSAMEDCRRTYNVYACELQPKRNP